MQRMDLSAFSKKDFDPKRWLNAALKVEQSSGGNRKAALAAAEGQASQLFTSLQVESQETAAVVEDKISQAMVRLPRTEKEIERMAAETVSLAAQLEVIGDTTCSTKTSHQQTSRLQELHHVDSKLKRCAAALKSAREVAQNVEQIERTVNAGAESGIDSSDLATQISAVEKQLSELQAKDPTFGVELRSRIDRFESDLQKSLERECLDALNRQDIQRAPKLLATLRTIQRDAPVVDQYVAGVITKVRSQFSKELQSASGAGMKTILASFNKTVAKLLSSRKEYHVALFEGNADASDKLQRRILQKLFSEIAGEIEAKLMKIDDNEVLVTSYESSKEMEKSLKDYPDTLELVLRPYKNLVQSFTTREEAVLRTTVDKAQGFSDFSKVVEAIEQWAARAAKFFPSTTVPPACKAWNAQLERFSSALLQKTFTSAPNTSDEESTRRDLAAQKQCAALLPQLTSLEEKLASRLSKVDARPNPILKEGKAAMDILHEKCRERVKKSLSSPISSMMKAYGELPLWQPPKEGTKPSRAGAEYTGPCEPIRNIGEYLLSLPVKLEADDVDQDDIGPWTSLVVGDVVKTYDECVSKLAPFTQPKAISQLQEDIGYLQNVFNALGEEEATDTLDALQQRVAPASSE